MKISVSIPCYKSNTNIDDIRNKIETMKNKVIEAQYDEK